MWARGLLSLLLFFFLGLHLEILSGNKWVIASVSTVAEAILTVQGLADFAAVPATKHLCRALAAVGWAADAVQGIRFCIARGR